MGYTYAPAGPPPSVDDVDKYVAYWAPRMREQLRHSSGLLPKHGARTARTVAVCVHGEAVDPVGWPVKYRAELVAVRALLAVDGVPLKAGSWNWEKDRDRFVVTFDDGRPGYDGPVAGLAAWLGLKTSPKQPTVARKAAAPKPAPVVVAVPDLEPEPVAAGDELDAYVARLVYGPKAAYAAAYVDWVRGAGPEPADPGTEWAAKVRAKVSRLGVKVAA